MPDSTPADHERPSPATVGLLPYLTMSALDEDYEHAAARRTTQQPHSSRRIGPVGAIAVVASALLVVVAATQTSRNAVADRDERQQLISQIQNRQHNLDEDGRRVDRLLSETTRLRNQLLGSTKLSTGVRAQLSLLSVRAGTTAVRGPGVKVVVDNAKDAQSDRNKVLDSDLQHLVNGLWEAGAEAIAINGHRLTTMSAIRQAGRAITVNYVSLVRPYTVLAIGDPRTLPARFAETSSGQAWLDLQREVQLRFSMHTQDKLTLPAAAVPTLRFAEHARKGGGS